MPNQTSKVIDRETSVAHSGGIPEGFVLTISPDGQHWIMPEYLVPPTDQAFAGYRKQIEFNVTKEQGGVRVHFVRQFVSLSMEAHWPMPIPWLMPIDFDHAAHESFADSIPDSSFTYII